MRLQNTQKQKLTLRNFHRIAQSDNAYNLKSKLRPMRTSGVFVVSLTAIAGVTGIALALQHHEPAQSSLPSKHSSNEQPSSPTTSVQGTSSTTVDVSAEQSTAPDSFQSSSSTTGAANINGEVIPLSDGTVQRSFTDSSGNEHTVTISVDGQTTTVESHSSSTDIVIDNNSESIGAQNNTRGSPHR